MRKSTFDRRKKMTLSSSVAAAQEASHHDELFMQQSLLFSDKLEDLKNLRKQLYAAAEYFEKSYSKEDQKQVVMGSLKDYTVKALVNTVDHLGSVAYKINSFLDEKIDEISGIDLRFYCMEQRLHACQKFINHEGLSQQRLVIKIPRHHKRYIFPDLSLAGESADATYQSISEYKAAQVTREPHLSCAGEGHSLIHFPQSSREETYTFTMISPINKPEKRAVSPLHSTLMHSGALLKRSISPLRRSISPLTRSTSPLKRSTSPGYYNAARRYPSEPRRSVSLSAHDERDTSKSNEENSSKNKRLFKALLSMRKSRKDAILYKYLDDK